MKKLALLSVPFAAALSSPALAQDTTAGGFRLEALVGYDIVKAEVEEGEGRDAVRGVFGGGAVGYDFPFGSALSVGADAELTFATTDIDVDDLGEIKADRDIYVGGRITGNISDSLALYGKVGYTNLNVSLNLEDDEDDVEDFDLDGNLDGVRAAVGVQFRTQERSYYGFEYRYSNYEADVIRHQGTLVIGYRF